MEGSARDRAKLAEIAFGALAGLGLGVSGLLLYEYTSTAAVCGPGGGCSVVRASSYASLGGVPTPLYGVVFFAVAAALRIAGGAASRVAVPVWLGIGAVAGVGFIAIQALVLGAYCKLCLVVDLSSIGLLATWALTRQLQREPVGRPMPTAGLVAAIVPLALGIALADRPPEPAASSELPAPIAAEQRPGVVTVVEFLDFQCPHCRLLHGELETAKEQFDGELRIVRKMIPLPAHEHANGAAIAYVCAEAQDRGDALADAMMAADDIGDEGRELLAGQVGIDMKAWRDCIGSDFARDVIKKHVAEAQAVGVRGLPTYFIGAQRFTGARRAADLVKAMREASSR